MSGFGRFSLPLVPPLETAAGTIDHREGFLVRLGGDPIGIGEATPLAGWTENLDACRAALADTLETADSVDNPDGLPDLSSTPAARHGLELALLDRQARAAGEPLYRLLGGGRRVTTVPVNATVGDGDIESTVDVAEDAVERGFAAVKVKVGARSINVDLERLSAVRAAVGEGVELRADANGAWKPEQAETAIHGLARRGVAMIEQPLSSDAVWEHADLRGHGVDIALDESLRDHPVEEVLAADVADVFVLKPMVHGGIGRCVSLAEQAAERGIDVVVTTTFDAAVARTAAVHLSAALNVDRACGLATADRLAADVGGDPATVVDGVISVPQGAGHGVGAEDLD